CDVHLVGFEHQFDGQLRSQAPAPITPRQCSGAPLRAVLQVVLRKAQDSSRSAARGSRLVDLHQTQAIVVSNFRLDRLHLDTGRRELSLAFARKLRICECWQRQAGQSEPQTECSESDEVSSHAPYRGRPAERIASDGPPAYSYG